ncbi:unnamed protein product [Caenorhabditis bovis]|uniref:Uncharacterized protein n=1 Tax=Caenorhabditis bovis TaxID=2654633 RepID=A0A8S1E7T4_9PELO|nr:unnamed protein product [Caenorhabditis bovis]
MRAYTLLLVTILLVSLFITSDCAKDRKKKKQRHEEREMEDEERESGGRLSENNKEKEKETRERVHAMVERQEERKKEKEEENSEEKDDEEEKKKSNATEIVVPRFKRSPFHGALQLVQDGLNRIKRSGDMQQMKKSGELNDGAQLPISKKPAQETNYKAENETKKGNGNIEI